MIANIKNYKFKIRNCEDKDYGFVYTLSKKNMYALFVKHWGEWNPKVFKDNFHKKNIRIVEYGAKRVAFFDFEFKDNFSYIHNVQVSTSMQGKGLGTFLMYLMERDTKKYKLRKIRLKVFKDNIARKLYLKLGYKQIKDAGSAVILEKKL
ncbi:MAG TPA: GNAT family N-acetyltransferase [Nanoarchaeota archaeon]|nr:GNAT family N-acetyltransferase [Nanoarchaeota archaeon]